MLTEQMERAVEHRRRRRRRRRVALVAGLASSVALALVLTWAPLRNPSEDWLFRDAGGRGCYGCNTVTSTPGPPPALTPAEKVAAACGAGVPGRLRSLPEGERIACYPTPWAGSGGGPPPCSPDSPKEERAGCYPAVSDRLLPGQRGPEVAGSGVDEARTLLLGKQTL